MNMYQRIRDDGAITEPVLYKVVSFKRYYFTLACITSQRGLYNLSTWIDTKNN